MNKNINIIRFYQDNRMPKLIFRGVTETQAKEWCRSEKTRKAGKWFGGFSSMGIANADRMPKYNKYFNPEEL